MFSENISNEQIALLPKAAFTGRIVVVNTADELNNELALFNTNQIVGFDTETKPSFKKGNINSVALLQIANSETAILVQLQETGITNSLKKLLESPSVIKVGAAIRDDIKSLRKIRDFKPNGFIDLQNHMNDFGIEALSVRKMAAIILGVRISKSQQLSNWEHPELTEGQQLYAATDAWICQQIFITLQNKRNQNHTHNNGL
ncbi:MAG: 3'-5' exonuclease domain-containing protein 2 [Bacteroidales bacterium]|nr:3'-5' exonuclease domain-containing protein 2 [Bacteroidales bacterium]MBN2750795.1 3'-5' exonuclease domain-containing protein 2 [Bacteroidales bacterium]